MDSYELIILDVGHGNCAIIRNGTDAIIIDAPGRPIVSRVLDDLGIKSIHSLLISHADSDHLSGTIPILLDPARPVRDVYVNPDNRKTAAWLQFRIAAAEARKVRGTAVHTSLNLQDPGQILFSQTKLRVLSPTPEMCLATNAGMNIDGLKNDANIMSAVVLVEHDGENICLLAADSGYQSLEEMIQEGADMKSAMLVFPHHGGHVGGTADNKDFAMRLVAAVEPKVVIFSIGRGSHGTPRPEIIAGVREGVAGLQPYIACTQLSRHCATDAPKLSRTVNKNSDGLKKDSCCAGTVSWPLEKDGFKKLIGKLNESHNNFVVGEIPDALCRRLIGTFPIKVTAL